MKSKKHESRKESTGWRRIQMNNGKSNQREMENSKENKG